MELEVLKHDLTICKIKDVAGIDLKKHFYFIGRTDEEISLVCITEDVPENIIEREDGWKGFRIRGMLDFSLVGILAPIAKLMADNDIGIFAVSTFNTDYILVKTEKFERAVSVLSDNGYSIVSMSSPQ